MTNDRPNNHSTIKHHLAALLLCVLIGVLINWKIIHDGVLYSADDIWWHLFWLKEFIGELNEGIIYPRWLAQSNFLYGSPTFVFYPPLCFYVAAALQKLMSLSIMQTTTALCLLGSICCGYSFYLCGWSRWGAPAALGAAVLLMTSPFVAFDIYFRASTPELCALAWLSIIMFSVDQIEAKHWRYLLAIGTFCLATTHLPSLFMYLVAWATRVMFCAATGTTKRAKLNIIKANVCFASLGLGAAAFFLLPMIMERRDVNIGAILDQLKWQATLIGSPLYHGYFIVTDLVLKSSAAALILICLILVLSSHGKNSARSVSESLYWFFLNLFTLFLMAEPSRALWQWCKLLQCLQFPYRWMTVNCFSTAMLFAIALQLLLTASIKKYLKALITTLLLCLLVRQGGEDFLITKYRSGLDNPTPYIADDNIAMARDDDYARRFMPLVLQGAQGYPGVPEYRPLITGNGSEKPPPAPVPGKPPWRLTSGHGIIEVSQWTSYQRAFSTDSSESIVVNVRTFVYPGWRLYIDHHLGKFKQADDGSMLVALAVGKHQVEIKYEDTMAFRIGIAISVISLLILLLWYRYPQAVASEPHTSASVAPAPI